MSLELQLRYICGLLEFTGINQIGLGVTSVLAGTSGKSRKQSFIGISKADCNCFSHVFGSNVLGHTMSEGDGEPPPPVRCLIIHIVHDWMWQEC